MNLAELLKRTMPTESGCLEWTGSIGNDGYGRFRGKGAHRLVWQAANRPLIAGECVLHRCDNPPCVNPEHLFVGTHQDNMADMKAKRRARSPQGEAKKNVRLRAEDVREIKRLIRCGDRSLASIAREFGVVTGTVAFIANGRNWSHVA